MRRNLEIWIRLLSPRHRPHQQNRVAALLEFRRDSLRHIVQNANNPQHRRRINSFALGLVVERNIAAGDRCPQCRAGLSNSVDRRRKLRHDLRLLGIAEVQTIRRRHRRRAGHRNLACGFGHGVHRTQFRIEITPSPIAVECHGQTALMMQSAGPLDAHHAGFATRPEHGIGLHHRVVLLVNPALRADIGTRQQLLQICSKVPVLCKFVHCLCRSIRRHGRRPRSHRPVIERRIIGQRLVRNIGHQLAMMPDAQPRIPASRCPRSPRPVPTSQRRAALRLRGPFRPPAACAPGSRTA